MFNISENIMQMIFITIDEDSKENTGIDLNDEKNIIETACTGCYSGCVGSCLNVCSGSRAQTCKKYVCALSFYN